MDTETKQEFENLAVIIAGSFEKVDKKLEEIEQKMATKEDLAKAESRLDAKIDIVKDAVDDVKVELSTLSERDKEDTEAVVHEIVTIKQRIDVLEHTR